MQNAMFLLPVLILILNTLDVIEDILMIINVSVMLDRCMYLSSVD